MIKKSITALVIVGSLSACVAFQTPSLSNSYSYTQNSHKALVVYSSPYVSHQSFVVANKISEESRELGEPVFLGISETNNASLGNRANPEFRIAEIPPGTYSWSGIHNGGSNYYNYCRGTMAFKVEPGVVNLLVAKKSLAPDQATMDRLKAEIIKFTNITAPIKIAEIPYGVKFDFALDKDDGCRTLRLKGVEYKRFSWEKFVQNKDGSDNLD